MSHPNHILLQSTSFNKDQIINKFLEIIGDILGQFGKEQLDQAVYFISKGLSDEEDRALFAGIYKKYKSKNNLSADSEEDEQNGELKDYVMQAVSSIPANEQLYILAHINPEAINKYMGLNLALFDAVYRMIRFAIH